MSSKQKATGSGPGSVISLIEENNALSERALSLSLSTWEAAGSLSVRLVVDVPFSVDSVVWFEFEMGEKLPLGARYGEI